MAAPSTSWRDHRPRSRFRRGTRGQIDRAGIGFAAGLRQIAAGDDAEPGAQRLEQNRHGVRHHEHPEEAVAETGRRHHVCRPVAGVHIAACLSGRPVRRRPSCVSGWRRDRWRRSRGRRRGTATGLDCRKARLLQLYRFGEDRCGLSKGKGGSMNHSLKSIVLALSVWTMQVPLRADVDTVGQPVQVTAYLGH